MDINYSYFLISVATIVSGGIIIIGIGYLFVDWITLRSNKNYIALPYKQIKDFYSLNPQNYIIKRGYFYYYTGYGYRQNIVSKHFIGYLLTRIEKKNKIRKRAERKEYNRKYKDIYKEF